MVYWERRRCRPRTGTTPCTKNFQHAIEEYRILLASGAVDEAMNVYYSGLQQLNIENGIRDRLDYKNAKMLGYNTDFDSLVATDYGAHIAETALEGGAARSGRRDRGQSATSWSSHGL